MIFSKNPEVNGRENVGLAEAGRTRICMREISVKNLIIKISERVASILEGYFGPRLVSVCLYGSASRGSFRKGSDIDLLIVLKDAPSSYHKRVKEIMPLFEKIRLSEEYRKLEKFELYLEPSLLILTQKEIENHPDILIDISQEGILIFDREDFLKKHLNQIKNKMVKLGSIKKHTPYGHYWSLKPNLHLGEILEL